MIKYILKKQCKFSFKIPDKNLQIRLVDIYSLAQQRTKRQLSQQAQVTQTRSYAPVRTTDYRAQQVRLSSSTRRAYGSNTVEQETEERTANVATSLFARSQSRYSSRAE